MKLDGYFDFARAFAPDWLARFISMSALGVLALVLIALVLLLKVVG